MPVAPERIIELAWRTSAPTWTRELDFRPDSLWPKIAMLALRWQAEGLSEEQMEAQLAAAEAEVEAYHTDYTNRLVAEQRRGPLPKAERISGDVAERTRDLTAELLNPSTQESSE